MRLHFIKRPWPRPKGQSLVEMTVLLPILLLLLSGLIEFGFMFNEYLSIQDAVRNAARFASDSDYTAAETVDPTGDLPCDGYPPNDIFPKQLCCSRTTDFYRQTACLVNQELSLLAPEVKTTCLQSDGGGNCLYAVVDPNDGDTSKNDIILSVFSIEQGSPPILLRFPPASTGNGGEEGWSYALAYSGYNVRNQSSKFSTSAVQNRLSGTAPSTGVLLLELFYNYDQKLKLPWITAFLDDPVTLHVYAFMPLVSAEPTPTPIP
ncbi:MAG TPA: hypothetical protein ENJ02_08880 [Chloroflexi bacterium]|nr:hypothetical protein [Chloroflexota bacterium]